MKRTLVIVALAAATVSTFGSDLSACGDKSLATGGIRMQRALAAKYPASILIYMQPNSRIATAARELKLQEALRQVGHTYREVSSRDEFDTALRSGQFNVVMTDLADLTDVQRHIDASTSRAVTVGVAYKLTKAEARQAAQQFRFLINAPSRAAQYLTTITEAVRSNANNPHKG